MDILRKNSKFKVIIIVVAAFVFTAAISLLVFNHLAWINIKNVLLSKSVGIEVLIKENFRREADRFHEFIKILGSNREIKDAFQRKDYHRVESIAMDHLKYGMLKNVFSGISFFSKEGTCLACTGNCPRKEPDDFFEKIIKRIRDTGEGTYGVRFNRDNLELCLINPWVIDSRLAGYIRVQGKLRFQLKNIKKVFGSDLVSCVYDKDGGISILKKSMPFIPKGLKEFLLTSPGESRHLEKVVVSGKTYFVVFLPVFDFKMRKTGSLAIIHDVTRLKKTLNYNNFLILAISAVTLIALAAVFYFYITRFEKRIHESDTALISTRKEFVLAKKYLGITRKELELSRERLNLALEGTEQGLWDWNITTGYLYLSPQFYRLFDYEPGEFDSTYNEWEKHVHPDDLNGVMRNIRNYIKEKSDSIDIEYRFRTKSGSWRWILRRGKTFDFDEFGCPTRLVGTDIDITARKRIENDLKESSARFKALFEDSPISLIEQDWSKLKEYIKRLKLDGVTDFKALFMEKPDETLVCATTIRPINFNNAALELLGATSNEDAERLTAGIFREENSRNLTRVFAAFADGASDFSMEGKIKTLEEKEIHVSFRFLVMPGYENNAERVLISIADISERVMAEKELFKAKVQAEAANKAKSIFLANMSHEIRTPLNAIIGFSDIVLESELGAEQRSNLEIVKKRGEDLLLLINDILDYSKIEAKKLKLESSDVNLRKIAEDVFSTFSAQMDKKGITGKITIADDIPDELQGDPFRIKQILFNIVSNAVKFTEKGSIHLNIELSPESSGEPDISRLAFTVSDTGSGIPEEKLETIFEDFSQADPSMTRAHGGTGLGLAITKSLIGLMGGSIRAESSIDEGSVFYFDLELKISERPKQLREKNIILNRETVRLKKHLSILAAEDESTNQLLLKKILTKYHHKVTVVSNGIQAVEATKKGGFDLILMDVQMPEMDGLIATMVIRDEEREGEHIPIVALTAHAGREDIRKCFDAGMDAYLAKPVRKKELFKVISEVVSIAPGAFQP